MFNIADSKIKDRATEKPKFDLSYNPIDTGSQNSSLSKPLEDIFAP